MRRERPGVPQSIRAVFKLLTRGDWFSAGLR
jgi:hypothetical protein